MPSTLILLTIWLHLCGYVATFMLLDEAKLMSYSHGMARWQKGLLLLLIWPLVITWAIVEDLHDVFTASR